MSIRDYIEHNDGYWDYEYEGEKYEIPYRPMIYWTFSSSFDDIPKTFNIPEYKAYHISGMKLKVK